MREVIAAAAACVAIVLSGCGAAVADVRVGPGPTRAHYRLEGTGAVRGVLQLLAESAVRHGVRTAPEPASR